jgi:hypothetical protein
MAVRDTYLPETQNLVGIYVELIIVLNRIQSEATIMMALDYY